MGFREYLSEMPYFNMKHHKALCPMGDIVDGSKYKYHYDLATEFMPKGEFRSRLEMGFGGMFGKPNGTVPIYCNVHSLLFLFDFNKNEVVKPNVDQIAFLKTVKKAMDVWSKNNKINRKIKLFT